MGWALALPPCACTDAPRPLLAAVPPPLERSPSDLLLLNPGAAAARPGAVLQPACYDGPQQLAKPFYGGDVAFGQFSGGHQAAGIKGVAGAQAAARVNGDTEHGQQRASYGGSLRADGSLLLPRFWFVDLQVCGRVGGSRASLGSRFARQPRLPHIPTRAAGQPCIAGQHQEPRPPGAPACAPHLAGQLPGERRGGGGQRAHAQRLPPHRLQQRRRGRQRARGGELQTGCKQAGHAARCGGARLVRRGTPCACLPRISPAAPCCVLRLCRGVRHACVPPRAPAAQAELSIPAGRQVALPAGGTPGRYVILYAGEVRGAVTACVPPSRHCAGGVPRRRAQ